MAEQLYQQDMMKEDFSESSLALSVNQQKVTPLSNPLELDIDSLSKEIKVKGISLTWFQFSIILFTIIVSVLMIVSLLFIQYHNSQIIQATNTYKINTNDVQKQSNQMNEVITQQFNYGRIKQTALDHKMSIDKTRIRTVDE